MFTGIVKEIGQVLSVAANAEGKQFTVSSKSLIDLMQIDDSVSINGACQTITEIKGKTFSFQSVHVTLEKTNLGILKVGSPVNMELALRPMDFMGGHLVQGHVNCLGRLKRVQNTGNNFICSLEVPPEQMKYIVKEGSITVNGVSLTVSDIDRATNVFQVSIIPHTWAQTTLSKYNVGDAFNIEVDIIAKYLENLIFYRDGHKKTSSITEEWLKGQGY
jgi:riboflavin synthase